jgi:hypothetical protein
MTVNFAKRYQDVAALVFGTGQRETKPPVPAETAPAGEGG